MKTYRRSERVRAEQWFPGKAVEGVVGDQTPDAQGKSWGCGCALLGGPGFAPHIHLHPNGGTYHSALHSVLLQPGNWVIYLADGDRQVLTEAQFAELYEEVPAWESEAS